jgi:hypothetical protein
MLNGEVCVIDADPVGIDTFTDPTSGWVFEKVATFDPSGLKAFYSGGPTQMYKITKAVVVVDSAPPLDSYDFNTMPRQETLIAQSITPLALQFAKTIAFKQGADVTIGSYLPNRMDLTSDGNAFNVPIGAIEEIHTIVAPAIYYPNGSFIFFYFAGATGNTVTIVPGLGIVTPGARSFSYRAGDWAMLQMNNGNWNLVDKDTRGPWVAPGAFGAGWTGTLKYRISSDGLVTMQGMLTKTTYTSPATDTVHTLPSAYRPASDKIILINAGTVAGFSPVNINVGAATGNIDLTILGVVASGVSVSFDGISFYID